MTAGRSNGCHCKNYQDPQDKQLMQYQLIPNPKWRTLQHCCNFQSESVQTFGRVVHGCKKAKIMVHRWKTHCSSWAESVRSPTCWLIVRKKFGKVLLGNRWKRVPNWECLFVWEVGISAGGNTPHQATAQQMFPLALSTWKEECRSECRRSVEEKRWTTRRKTEKDRTRKQQGTDDQTLIMDDIKMEWRAHTDTLAMEWDAHQLWGVNCMRKMTCEVTLSVGYNESLSTVTETTCRKNTQKN